MHTSVRFGFIVPLYISTNGRRVAGIVLYIYIFNQHDSLLCVFFVHHTHYNCPYNYPPKEIKHYALCMCVFLLKRLLKVPSLPFTAIHIVEPFTNVKMSKKNV